LIPLKFPDRRKASVCIRWHTIPANRDIARGCDFWLSLPWQSFVGTKFESAKQSVNQPASCGIFEASQSKILAMVQWLDALSDAAIDWWRDHIYAQHGLYPDDLGELLSASATGGKVITIADLDPNVGSFVVRIKGFPSDSGEAWWTQRKLDLSGPLFEAQRMLIPSGDRQKGKGRMLMADLVDTAARFGIHTITIEAQDIGRYAWARFGFVPDRTAWMRSVRVEGRRRLKMANAEISPTAMVAYGEILDGENPKLIREVASWRDPVTSIVKFNKDTGLPEKVPLGQALLLETQEQWYGTFDLGDPETMEIFERYVGRT
jgi:GNAT superfamily N-acetyltransferase